MTMLSQEVIDEIARLRSLKGFKESLTDLEMESRHARKRRLPYPETLEKHARDKAEVLVKNENCAERFSVLTVNELINQLTREFITSCRDGL